MVLRDGMDGLAAVLGPRLGEGGAELGVLKERMSAAAHEHRPITLDVSGLTLLPDELHVLVALVGVASGATLSLVCDRLTGRRLLRRVLPTSVLIVLDHPATGPDDADATVRLSPAGPAAMSGPG